jgi:hypothetical protein
MVSIGAILSLSLPIFCIIKVTRFYCGAGAGGKRLSSLALLRPNSTS